MISIKEDVNSVEEFNYLYDAVGWESYDKKVSEKVLYRQVLDLYATAVDYNPKDEKSIEFFKIVQNKLHYAAPDIQHQK